MSFSFGSNLPTPSYPEDKELTDTKCPDGHVLVQTFNLKKRSPNYFGNTYSCELCGRGGLEAGNTPSANCITCQFDLCPPCLERYNPSQFQCDAGHKLSKFQYNFSLSGGQGAFGRLSGMGGKYECQSCQGSFQEITNPSMSCKPCNFSLCSKCFKKRVKNPEDQEEAKPEKPSPFKNTSNPFSNSSSSSVFGTSKNQGSGLFSAFANLGSGLSGLTINQGSGFSSAPKIEDKLLKDHKCPKGHELTQTANLPKKNPFRGKPDSKTDTVYKCNLCGRRQKARQAHCQICDYDVCADCIQKGSSTLEKPEDQTKIEAQPLGEDHCLGCKEAKKTHLLVPCGHVCACDKCSNDLVEKKGECPECKTQIESRIKVI